MRIVLLGGWGMPASVLEPLRMALGVSPEFYFALDRPLQPWLQQVRAALQPGSVLVGWSLGGNLALQLAAEAADRVSAVVTITCNPRFVATADWSVGYDPTQFARFQESLSTDPGATLQRFAGLQTLGSGMQREELRWLQGQLAAAPVAPAAVLEETLQLLATLDQRALLADLRMPVTHIYGAADNLVSAAVAAAVQQINPDHNVEVIAGMAHLPSARYLEPAAEAVRGAILKVMRSWC